jgi:4-diphosphocytidyl-2-C-methyl-D-erythritol kinase
MASPCRPLPSPPAPPAPRARPLPPPHAEAALAEAAPAKLNLHLHVTGRREDGYHLLDSLAVFVALADHVSAAPAAALSLSVTGPFAAAAGGGDDNLVLRAARALGPGRGAALALEKRIPVAAGLGGGSSDAAAALRILSRLWAVPPATPSLAVTLGADVPVCLAAAPARMQGIGEVLSPAPALPPGLGIVLANPRLPLATPPVFRARVGPFDAPASLPDRFADAADLATFLATTRNGLEAAALSLCPPIAAVLAACAALPGALLARMSGSGPTCFALFATIAEAEAAATLLRQREPGWWAWGGGLYREGEAGL